MGNAARRLGIGVLGLGRGATLTVPAFIAHPRCRIVAGTDPDPAARAGFAEATGAAAVADLAALLDMPEVEAIYIASPHEYHAEHTLAALAAGRHILVEKPMAIALADAAVMVAAAQAVGRVLMVGPSHGYDPPVERAAALAQGTARMIHASNYTDFLYRPRRPVELDRASGGGVVFSQATHQIDIVRRIAASPVKSVRGWVGDWDSGRPTDAGYTAMLNFENGAVATLVYSGVARFDSDRLSGWISEMGGSKLPDAHQRTRQAAAARGEAVAKSGRGFAGFSPQGEAPTHHEHFGRVIVSCDSADLELTPDGVVVHGDNGPVLEQVPLPPAPRFAVANALACAVLDRTPYVFDGRWGLETLACCHALLRSAAEGRDVAIADLLSELETCR